MPQAFNELIKTAGDLQASDIHIESGSTVFMRIRGELKSSGGIVSFETLKAWVHELLGARAEAFRLERSLDLSETIAGLRCRIHLFHSSRGLACSIRLLSRAQPTLANLNLHPHIQKLVEVKRGLILICGPTGSGKSSTIAALIQEMNVRLPYNIVTLEQPIEYYYRNQRSFIRQREVGRDTPSFEKGLSDAVREDPDVIVVGEMRDKDTIQQTLNAAETGHLVLATLHASNVPEALGRILSAFPAEVRDNVAAQLAQVLQTVVCQHLIFHEKFQQRIPVCELFFSTLASRAKIRSQDLTSIPDTYYAGTEAGCLHADRYRQWVDAQTILQKPSDIASPMERTPLSPEVLKSRYAPPPRRADASKGDSEVYSIDSLEEDDLWDAIKKLED